MEEIAKQFEVYENIIENLIALKEEAMKSRQKEAEAIGDILQALIALRDCFYDSDIKVVYITLQPEEIDAVPVGRYSRFVFDA